MKILERFTEWLSTPGPRRWNIFSFSFLVPAVFALLLEDWLGFEGVVSNPVTLTLVGMFFLSQALVHTLDRENVLLNGQAQLGGSPKWLIIIFLLVCAAGTFYMAAAPLR